MTLSAGSSSRSRSAMVGVVVAIRPYPRFITALFTHVRPEDLATCVSCGLCLNDCPTYRVLGDEADSPRGRIQLIRELVGDSREQGQGPLGAERQPPSTLVGHLEACLVCRACETACPSGVPFGRIMEGAREIVRERAPESRLARTARRTALGILADPARLALATRLLALYQRTGLQRLARRLGLVPKA